MYNHLNVTLTICMHIRQTACISRILPIPHSIIVIHHEHHPYTQQPHPHHSITLSPIPHPHHQQLLSVTHHTFIFISYYEVPIHSSLLAPKKASGFQFQKNSSLFKNSSYYIALCIAIAPLTPHSCCFLYTYNQAFYICIPSSSSWIQQFSISH